MLSAATAASAATACLLQLATRNSQPATAPWHARDYGQFGTGGMRFPDGPGNRDNKQIQTRDSIRYDGVLVSPPPSSPFVFHLAQLQPGPAERLLALHCISAPT
jgi:hypothetical protein